MSTLESKNKFPISNSSSPFSRLGLSTFLGFFFNLTGTGALALLTLFVSIYTLLVMSFRRNREAINWGVKWWCQGIFWSFGVRIRPKGLEKLPPYMANQNPLSNRGVLFVFNHSSNFDVFALALLQPMICYGAKVELFKIPLFGQAMRRAGVLPINRSNREEVFNVYSNVKPRVDRGERFGLAPEGKRNFQESPLLPFKTGPFIFAISTQSLIVPVLIRGAFSLWPKSSPIPKVPFRWSFSRKGLCPRPEIEVEFLDPIDAKDYSLETRHQLRDQVQKMMSAHLLGHPRPLPPSEVPNPFQPS